MVHAYMFHICILPYLCVMQYSTSKDIAKLATFESQKEVCTTHLWNPKKGEKGQGVETNATGIIVLLKPLNKGRHG